jgi:hypothetical protein
MKNMFEVLCETYGTEIPDIDLFVNRRDFPIRKLDRTEPYHHLWDSRTQPLVSYAYDEYAPILSSCTASGFADLTIPTMDDWARVLGNRGIHFASSKRTMTIRDVFGTPWNRKKELAVFRGTSTGIGVTPETNVRLRLVTQFQNHPYCNVGLTAFNTRPRKISGEPKIQFPRTDWVPLSNAMSMEEQSTYKYIIHVPGHVQAYRLSIELATGSVVLLVASEYKLWYEDKLVAWEHYVPVSEDLSDLDERIQWCLQHDAECQEIAQNARHFYETYLSREGCLSYLKNLLEQIIGQVNRGRDKHPDPSRLYTPYLKSKIRLPPMYTEYTLFKNVNTVVCVLRDSYGYPLVRKTALRKGRKNRFDHEYVIGKHAINPLTQKIPNFIYTHALTSDGLYLDFVPGNTLFDFIRGPQFQLNEWYFHVLQTFLAVGVAQRACFFTHHDLCPWNIVLRATSHEITTDYLLEPDVVYRVQTRCVPIILDFDKTHVVHDLITFKHYFEYEPYQDVICLLISCLFNICKHQQLRTEEQQQILWLFREALCDPIYCPVENIRTFSDVVTALQTLHRYAHISFATKGGLKHRRITHVVELLRHLYRPIFTARLERVYAVEYRFLRGVSADQVNRIHESIDTVLHPLLALHWKQYFYAYLRELDLSERDPIDTSSVVLPILTDWKKESVLLLSPKYLDFYNRIVDMLYDGGPFAMYASEKTPLYAMIQQDEVFREKILAYSKHLTKIKLTRNILY